VVVEYWPWSTRDAWDLQAPLSRSSISDKFETQEKCQGALAVMREENAAYLASSIQAWQCVASDDPRLEKVPPPVR
jgi:hypothetical protein